MQVIGYKNIMDRGEDKRSICLPIFKAIKHHYVQIIDPLGCQRTEYKKIDLPKSYVPLKEDDQFAWKRGIPLIIFLEKGGFRLLNYDEFLTEILFQFDVQKLYPDPYFYHEISYFLKAPSIIERQSKQYNEYLSEKGIVNSYQYRTKFSKLALEEANTVLTFYRKLYHQVRPEEKGDFVSMDEEKLTIGTYTVAKAEITAYQKHLDQENSQWLDAIILEQSKPFLDVASDIEQRLALKFDGMPELKTVDPFDALYTEQKLALAHAI